MCGRKYLIFLTLYSNVYYVLTSYVSASFDVKLFICSLKMFSKITKNELIAVISYESSVYYARLSISANVFFKIYEKYYCRVLNVSSTP